MKRREGVEGRRGGEEGRGSEGGEGWLTALCWDSCSMHVMWNGYTVIFIHPKCSMRQTDTYCFVPLVVITNFAGTKILHFVKPCRGEEGF